MTFTISYVPNLPTQPNFYAFFGRQALFKLEGFCLLLVNLYIVMHIFCESFVALESWQILTVHFL